MRLNMSRPMKSAPSQNTLPGRASEDLALVEVGSNGAMKSAKTAVKHEGQHDDRADRAQRIAPRVKTSWLRQAGDVGAGAMEFSLMVDDGHCSSPRT